MNLPCSALTGVRIRQMVLGIFVIGQLCFLVSANLIGFLEDSRARMAVRARAAGASAGWPWEEGYFWDVLEFLAATDSRWAEATGQMQNWSLFAPAIARECVFPAVEFRWDKDPAHELILSEHEPVDPERYLRFGNSRMRRYENNLVIALRADEAEDAAKTKARWRDAIRDHVANYAPLLQGYLRWHVGRAMARWPGRQEPRQVILVFRRYHISDYADAPPFWTGPHVVPMARWQPAVCRNSGHRSLEWFDPVTERWRSLPHE